MVGRRLLRERDAVLLAGLDLDGLLRGRLENLSERHLGRGGGGLRAARGHLLDVLGWLGGVLGMGTGRDGGEVEDGGGGGAASAATAVGEKAQEGEEDEEQHEGGADADANELPQVEPEDDGALVRVRHGPRRQSSLAQPGMADLRNHSGFRAEFGAKAWVPGLQRIGRRKEGWMPSETK